MAAASADIRLVAGAFDPAAELAAFAAAHRGAGGVVSFLGQVRAEGEVEALELRVYEPLTTAGMRELGAEALRRWAIDGLLVIHRHGVMTPGEAIVFVAAAARHRRDAFAAADFTMDHLKSESWFWKREQVAGAWRWIEPRAADYTDLERWRAPAAESPGV